MKKTLLFSILISFAFFANSQILKKVTDRVKNKVENKTNEKVDQGVDTVISKTEQGVKGVTKGNDESKSNKKGES